MGDGSATRTGENVFLTNIMLTFAFAFSEIGIMRTFATCAVAITSEKKALAKFGSHDTR
jgi:hypothetical protein